MGEEKESPGYVDFLAYSLINLYRIVDLLDVANSYNALRFTYLRPGPVAGRHPHPGIQNPFYLLPPETDLPALGAGRGHCRFLEAHPPIHERARNSLPMHGGLHRLRTGHGIVDCRHRDCESKDRGGCALLGCAVFKVVRISTAEMLAPTPRSYSSLEEAASAPEQPQSEAYPDCSPCEYLLGFECLFDISDLGMESHPGSMQKVFPFPTVVVVGQPKERDS